MDHTPPPDVQPPDIETAGEGYARRFGGAAGLWMLSVQETTVLELLAGAGVRTILDVGGGHGQLAGPLTAAGYDVTVQGSSPACAERLRDSLAAGRLRFVVAPLLHLPFPAASFDAAVAVRLLPHSPDWRAQLRELCRVARLAVIVDYPAAGGLQRLAPGLFAWKRSLEGNTRPWQAFSPADVSAEASRAGFRQDRLVRQFGAPMVLHRKAQAPRFSRAIERALAAAGWTRRFGSPILVRVQRSGRKEPA